MTRYEQSAGPGVTGTRAYPQRDQPRGERGERRVVVAVVSSSRQADTQPEIRCNDEEEGGRAAPELNMGQ
jgi:hypothetical protein